MTIHIGHMPLGSPSVTAGGVSSFSAYRARKRAKALQALRSQVETTIERLCSILDAIDGDPDFEPIDEREPGDDDELSCGWENEGSQALLRADDEREPSLGWHEFVNQSARGIIASGWLVEDGEDQCEDEGAQCDDEGAVEQDANWSAVAS